MSKHHSKDRASLCLYTFADGRRCRMLRAADPYLCNYHARRETEKEVAQAVGAGISAALNQEGIISATALSFALARTMAATAQGLMKPKTAAIIAYLGQNLMQAVQQARQEYIDIFGYEAWRHAVRSCFRQEPRQPAPEAQPAPDQDFNSTQPVEAANSDVNANAASDHAAGPTSPPTDPTPSGQAMEPIATAIPAPTEPNHSSSQPIPASSPLPHDRASYEAAVLACLNQRRSPKLTPTEATLTQQYENKRF